MSNRKTLAMLTSVAAIATAFAIVRAQPKPKEKEQEQERKVTEAEVPKAAMAALKKQAGDNKILKFEEEIEHGIKYYEGSWKGPTGHIDTLVTEAGDLVEIKEGVPGSTVPKPAVDAAEKEAGKGAAVRWEKKTVILYEAKFTKGSTRHELVVSPDGRTHEHEKEEGKEDEDD